MKLKDLKKSTLYQSSDLDDMTIMIAVCRNGVTQYEPLCFMGWHPLPETPAGGFVVIGGLTELQRLVESGKMKAPEGYVSPDESKLGYDDEDTSA